MPNARTLTRLALLGLLLAGCPNSMTRTSEDVTSVDRPVMDSPADTNRSDASDASANPDGATGPEPSGNEPSGNEPSGSEPTGSEPSPDAGLDATLPDTVVLDVNSPEVELRDGPLPDSCSTTGADGGRSCATDGDCRAGVEVCRPTGCAGETTCVPAGRGCMDNRDCLAGFQQCMGGTCVATGADCGDTRACPLGFFCEGTPRRCVDHRRPCLTGGGNPCPFNAYCAPAGPSLSYCVPAVVRCNSNAPCLLGTTCRDIDGDGLRECAPDGVCSAAACAGRPLNCEIEPNTLFLQCGFHGICNSTTRPCPSGYDCLDPWGTGIGECHLRTDPCQVHAACPAGQLCYGSPPDGTAMLGCN